ncbi:MAG TPA: methyltransferase, partial [Leptolyngbyaceae cyanobacterium M65_K2018_010]|nr:methyltransferase [Leptolyngbyaceae cyanobacterium M65_K2018_010]
MFEYGGGGSYEQGQGGWAPHFLRGTLDSLKSLQRCGYDFSILIDYAPGTQAKVFSLQNLDLAVDNPFYRQSIYGNLLCFHQHQYPEAQVQAWCAAYRGGVVNWSVSQWVMGTVNLQRWW